MCIILIPEIKVNGIEKSEETMDKAFFKFKES